MHTVDLLPIYASQNLKPNKKEEKHKIMTHNDLLINST